MNRKTGMVLAALVIGASSAGFCMDYNRTGTIGLNYTVGPSFIAGGSGHTQVGSVEPGVGAGLQLGLTRNLDATLSYDYIDADLRSQALTFGGQWRFPLWRTLGPFVGAGIGFGMPSTGESWGHFSLKLLGGIEKPLTDDVSLAGTLSYQYIEGPDPLGSVHAIEPGVRLNYYFGAFHR